MWTVLEMVGILMFTLPSNELLSLVPSNELLFLEPATELLSLVHSKLNC